MRLETWLGRLPWALLLAVAALLALGIAAIARWEELAGLPISWSRQQLLWGLLGCGVMVAAAWPSYRRLLRASYPLYALLLVALIAVFFFPPINGAHRWIRAAGIGVQPSELAKVAHVLALSRWLMYRDNFRGFSGMFGPLALTLVPMVLILREPDLGTSLVLLPVLLFMLFAAGARTTDLLRLAFCGLLAAPLLWSQMSLEQQSRVWALFDQPPPGARPSADAYHLHQAKQMLALGGVWGSCVSGAAVDNPAAYRLPAAHTDFVFALVGERFGWWGLGGTLTLYVVLVWQALRIAEATQEPFGRLVAAGVASLFAVEVLINTGMTVGLLPVTGLALPLVSYGGSGVVAHSLALGLLLGVAIRPGYEVSGEPFRHATAPAQ